MTRAEQWDFINEICEELRKSLLAKADKIPAEWDGIEIREWMADYAKGNAIMDSRPQYRRRKRDYKNAVLVNNL